LINIVWLYLMLFGVITAAVTGKSGLVTATVFMSAQAAIEFTFGLAGAIAFWSGMLRVAEAAGLTAAIAKLFLPFLKKFFPELTGDRKTLGLIAMTIAANLLGLGNVATPLGLKTMEELQRININKEKASNEMCVFLTIVLGGLCFLPTTLIAVRAKAGSSRTAAILGPLILITLAGTAVGLLVNFLALKSNHWRRRKG